MYAFHVTVPAGASSLDVAFDFISPPEAAGFSSGASATTELAVLELESVAAVSGRRAGRSDCSYQANLKVPNGWSYGTALPIARESGNEIEFQPSSLDHADRFAGFDRERITGPSIWASSRGDHALSASRRR